MLHFTYTKTDISDIFPDIHDLHFPYFIPYEKLHDFCYFMNAHTQPCPTCQSSYYQKQIKVKIGQSDLILTLNCVTVSKWVLQIKKKTADI